MELKLGDVYEGFEEEEPGQDQSSTCPSRGTSSLTHRTRLVPGGLFFGFIPTVPQVDELVRTLRLPAHVWNDRDDGDYDAPVERQRAQREDPHIAW